MAIDTAQWASDHEQSPSNLSELCHQTHNPFWYFQCLPLTWDFSADPFLGNQAGEIVQD